MTRRIEIVGYDKDWPGLFREEADRLCGLFSGMLVAVHHIGSTSVPGLAAKPIVDVLAEVDDIARVDDIDNVMREHGYIPKGAFGIEGRRFFIRGTEDFRTHHIHVFTSGDTHVRRHLIFRDYLIAHPDEAGHYAVVKRKAADTYPNDIIGYMAAKDAFIRELLDKAEAWRNGIDRLLAKDDEQSL